MQQKNLIGTTMGQYQILDELGRGGMAVVYKAWQPSLRRYVALKVLLPYLGGDPEFIQRFQQEAIVAANLSHPHIVTIYEVGQQEGYIFIAMEYVEGKSLEQVILDQGALPLERAIRILRQVAEALDYAHKRRFLHRDIKPANILLAEDDRVVITDFGIAKALEGSGATARLTASGTVLGTPAYMSPEQIQGLPVDHRSDLYALGIVAYEMLSGQVPFDGTTTALLYAQVNNPPPAISRLTPGLPAHVEWVISRMLAKQPEERFMTAGEFVEALAGGAAATAIPAPVGLPTPAPAGSPRPTPAPRGGTAVMPPGAGVPPQPYVPPASPPAPQGYGTPPGGLPVGNSPAGYGYPSTQAAPPPAAPVYGYGYPQPAWPEPAPVKQKRAVWPWLVGGGLVLVIVAAAVLGYLFLGRETPAALVEEGTTALTAQDFAAAEIAFQEALKQDPENAAAQRGLGWVYYQTGRYTEASAAFAAAAKLEPENIEGAEGWGRSAYAAGQYEEALEPLRRWTAGAPTNAEAYRLLGETCSRLQLYEEAAQAFSRAVELEPLPADYRALGDSYRALGDQESAAAAYQRWTELEPGNAEAYRVLGMTLNRLSRYDEAEAAFSRSLELEASPAAYQGLGDIAYAQKDYEGALSYYQKALDLDPEVAALHAAMGWSLYQLQRYPEALAEFQTSLATEATGNGYQGLGNCYRALENYDAALKAYQNWLKLSPQSAWPYKAVGETLYKLQRYEEAVDIFTQAVKLEEQPGIVDCYMGLGNSYMALKEYRAALDAFQNWLSRMPGSAGANAAVAAAYIGLGDCTSARPYLDKALGIDPNYSYAKNLLKQCEP